MASWAQRPRLDREQEDNFWAGAAEATRFFMGESDVQRVVAKVAHLLEEDGIPYSVIGAMALNEYGYRRVTVDVDLLLTREGLESFKKKHLGLGYVAKFPGSKGFRDTEFGVTIDVVLAGSIPATDSPSRWCSRTPPASPCEASAWPCCLSPA